MPPLTATTLHSLQESNSYHLPPRCPYARLGGFSSELSYNKQFEVSGEKTPTATNKNRTDGKAVSEKKKLKSFPVCFDRQQEGLRQRRR